MAKKQTVAAKKKTTENKILYRANGRRAEYFGGVEKGDLTTLPGYTPEMIAGLVHEGYYTPMGVPPEEVLQILKEMKAG